MKSLKSFLAQVLFVLTYVDSSKAATCTASSNQLVVAAGASCTLTSSLTGLTSVSISGTVFFSAGPGSVPILEATNIYVLSTGKILADGYGYEAMDGPGKGSTSGSGGKSALKNIRVTLIYIMSM